MLSNVGQQSSLRMVFFLFLSLRLRSLLSSFYSMHVWIEATLIKTIFFVSWSKPSRVNYFNKIKITDISFFPKGTGAFSRPVKFRFVSFFVFIYLRSNKKPHTCSATLRARSLSIIVRKFCWCCEWGGSWEQGLFHPVFFFPFSFLFLFYKHGPAAFAISRLYTFTVVRCKRDVLESTSLCNISTDDDRIYYKILLQSFISTTTKRSIQIYRVSKQKYLLL